jgi:galactonate dehydratase
MMAIPTGPGLDIDIDERAITRYPYEARDLRHYTGQLTEIRPDDATAYFIVAKSRNALIVTPAPK